MVRIGAHTGARVAHLDARIREMASVQAVLSCRRPQVCSRAALERTGRGLGIANPGRRLWIPVKRVLHGGLAQA